VPKAPRSERLKLLFGEPVDPDGDCKFVLDDRVLRIRVPGGCHLLDPCSRLTNAPRAVRDVEGDFTAQVKVRLFMPAWPTVGTPNFHAGMVVWHDERTYYVVGRTISREGDKAQVGASGAALADGRQQFGWGAGGGGLDAETVIFRAVRTGNTVKLSMCGDGQTWLEAPPATTNFPSKLAVGVYAGHNSGTPFLAEFEDFTVTPAEPGM
jgi:regulation of enolase protein 1 (concanavalin A-like superfamily)